MRLNGVIACILAGIGFIFLVCSRSDVISGAGERVVSDMDNTLTDTSRFVRIDLDSGDVDAAYSLPAEADPAFSTTFADSVIMAGVNGEGDTLAAYVQYRVAADTSRYKESDTTLKLEGVYLYFPKGAADSSGLPDTISLDWVKPLAESAPVNRGADGRHPDADELIDISGCPPPADTSGGGGSGCETTPVWPVKITLGGDNAVDSVKLPAPVSEKIFNAKISKNGDSTFAFSVYYGKKEVRGIKNPYMAVVISKAGAADSGKTASARDTVIDTIRAGASRFTVFEDADSAQNRKGLPYSSQRARRAAVFEISLEKIIRKTGKQGGYVNLNAVITIKTGSVPDKSNSGSAAGNYRVFVSDARFGDSDADSLNERFAESSSLLRSARPYDVLSISAEQPSNKSNPSIQDILDSGKRYIYVYLRAETEGGAIVWDKPEPIRVETVFTPPRY